MSDINFQNIETQNRYQKFLYGYESIFNKLVSLYKKNKLPNKIIFNGSDGIGKDLAHFPPLPDSPHLAVIGHLRLFLPEDRHRRGGLDVRGQEQSQGLRGG